MSQSCRSFCVVLCSVPLGHSCLVLLRFSVCKTPQPRPRPRSPVLTRPGWRVAGGDPAPPRGRGDQPTRRLPRGKPRLPGFHPLFKSEPSSRETDARAGVRGQFGGARATRPAAAGAGGTFVLGSVFPATPLLPPHEHPGATVPAPRAYSQNGFLTLNSHFGVTTNRRPND